MPAHFDHLRNCGLSSARAGIFALIATVGFSGLDVFEVRFASAAFAQEASSLPKYLEDLRSSDKQTRRDAAWAIEQLARHDQLSEKETKEVVRYLEKSLVDSDEQVRALSVDAVGKIGPLAAPTVSILIDKLKQGRGRGRGQSAYRAAYALGRIGAAALPKLVEAMSSDRSEVRAGATRAFGFLGKAALPEMDRLVAALEDSSDSVHIAAIRSLAQLGELAVESLTKALEHKSSDRRLGALSALAAIGKDAQGAAKAALSLLDAEDAEERSRALRVVAQVDIDANTLVSKLRSKLGEEDPDVRRVVIAAFARADREPVLKALREVLESQDDRAIDTAARLLEDFEQDAAPAVAAMVDCILRDAEKDRKSVARAIGKVGSEAVDVVFDGLSRKTTESRGAATLVEALVLVGSEALPQLARGLRHENEKVRAGCAEALSRIEGAGTTSRESLRRAMGDDSGLVRASATRAIGVMGPKDSEIKTIKSMLRAKDTRVRASATFAISRASMPKEELIPLLSAALDDDAVEVRKPAVIAFASLGEDAAVAVPAIAKILSGDDDELRGVAARSLASVGAPAKPALPALVTRLPSSAGDESLSILQAIGNTGGSRKAVDAVVEFSKKNSEVSSQRAALVAIGRMGSEAAPATDYVQRLFRESKDAELRADAVRTFAAICTDTKRVVAALTASLERKEDSPVRRPVVEVLASLGPDAQKAAPVLFEMLKNEYDRAMAFEALKKIQPRSRPLLKKALTHRERYVRVFACECIQALGSDAKDLIGELEGARDEDGDWRVRKSASEALASVKRALERAKPE